MSWGAGLLSVISLMFFTIAAIAPIPNAIRQGLTETRDEHERRLFRKYTQLAVGLSALLVGVAFAMLAGEWWATSGENVYSSFRMPITVVSCAAIIIPALCFYRYRRQVER